MARVELMPDAHDDLDHLLDYLLQHHASDAAARVYAIRQAIGILEHSPNLGRPARDGKRELLIGRAPHGYLASYRYLEELDTVFVLAIRSQRQVRQP